jgi:hypothetical protein
MKKLVLLLFVMLLFTCLTWAKPITIDQAKQVATNIMVERSSFTNPTIVSNIVDRDHAGQPLMYIFNFRPASFVMISAEDNVLPVLGYCLDQLYSNDNHPIQFDDLLWSYRGQIEYARTHKLPTTAEINNDWQRLSVASSSFVPINTLYRNVTPLIQTTWGQGTYYNALCPSGTPVGCVATAMSQIMRFWRYPTVGNGTKTYTPSSHPSYGAQTANFGATTYNWAAMPNSVNSSNISVATLCYHAGVSVSMDYDPTGSGAYSTDVPGALTSYFRYSSSAQYKSKSSYSTDAWDTLMRGELDNGRPIYYSGSGPAGGHAFILDGYTGTNSFHLNWGWDSWYNGYFTLANLNPGGDTFNTGQAAVIGIAPGSANFTLSEGFEGTTFPPTGWTLPVAGFARSATNFITGAYSARYNSTATGTVQTGIQLRTTKLTVDATSPALIFKARAGTTARSEQIKVGYSTSGSAPFTYFGTLATLTTSAQTFTYATNGLTPGDYYFVFETYCSLTTSASRTWIIDDVTGPVLWVNPLPTPALNITSWAAGSLAPGDAAYSGNTFQLSNTTGGTLTISRITDLSGTEYTTNFNTAITLVAGQVHEFGFSYEPLDYSSDPQSFVITTNGGAVTINLTGSAVSSVFSDGFESYSDFSLSFPPWTTYSVDTGTVGGISGVTVPNLTSMTSWMVFNPSTTTPATGLATAHIGAKYAMSMYNQSAVPNNDWLITPGLTLAGTPAVSFWAMSYSSSYLETFKVYYSTTNTTVPGSFTLLATQASVPNAWTNYSYSLPAACANHSPVYVAIVNASTDMFMLFIDDVKVTDNSSPGTPYFGNISGYVYRSGTTIPIVGATVTDGTKVTTSDANGYYHFNNLLVGTHTLACSATGQFYFDSSQSGVAVTNGNTTNQNLYLTWAEISVNPQTLTSSLYTGEAQDINLAISNPGGTADLEYELWLTTSTRGNNHRLTDLFNKKPSLSADTHIIDKLPIQHESDRAEGWMGYASTDDADTYMTAATTNREKATKFTIEDFGLWSNGVTISKLRAVFYNPTDAAWGTATNFYFKIYGSTGTGTALYTSPTYTATSLVDMVDVLATPLTITTNFWVSVYCVTNGGKPHLLGSTSSSGNSYYGTSSTAWTAASGFDWCIDAYITGNEWINASSYAGTVAPAATVNTTMHFDTTSLAVGTKNAYLYIFNNSNYNSPSTRGDYMVLPVSLTISTPPALGNISGIVYKYGTTTVIPGATVSIVGRSVVTGIDGSYSFTGVSAVTHTLTVTATGYVDYSADVVIPTNSTLTKNVYMNFAEVYTADTVFSRNLNVGATTSINVNMTNTGNTTLEFETASGVWGGTSFPTTAMNETFEASNSMTGWSGLVGPNSDIYTGYAYAGTKNWVFASFETTSAQYIITPKMRVVSGDNLAFWYKQYNLSSETFMVEVSTTDNSYASFTTIATIGPLADQAWTNFSTSLNAYAGQDIYIMFYYPRVDGYQYGYIMIDDVTGPTQVVPPSLWLSCTPVGYPVNETLTAGNSTMLTLNIDATTLPVGTYTAQTWVYSNGVVSPYKLYVTLNVSAATAPATPVVSSVETVTGGVSITWGSVPNAVVYRVYGCDSPYGTYSSLGFTGTTTKVFTDAQLEGFGLTSKGFFKVTADSESRSASGASVPSKTSSQLIQNVINPDNNKQLNVLN